MVKSSSSPSEESDGYKPVDCPKNPNEMCEALNVWAEDLYKWAQDVTKAIWPPPGPGTGNPPPPPPFK